MVERVGIEITATAEGVDAAFAKTQERLRATEQGATRVSEGFRQVASTAGTVLNVMTRLDIIQLTLANGQQRLAKAQELYNRAVRDHGPSSRQAVDAQVSMERAARDLERAQLRAKLSTSLMALEVASLAAQIPRAVLAIRSMNVALLTTPAGLAAVGIGLLAAGGAYLLFRDQVGASTDQMAEFKAEAARASEAEALLTASAGRATGALDRQERVEKLKTETTAQFVQRLVDMGHTEAEIRARFDEAAGALLSQKEAAEAATGAMVDLAAANRAVGASTVDISMPGGARVLRTQTPDEVRGASKRGFGGFIPPPSIGAIGGGQKLVVDPTTGNVSIVQPPKASTLTPGAVGQGGVTAGFFGPINPFTPAGGGGFLSGINLLQPTTILKAIGLAHGFDGMVRSPTLFMAGEAGAEHVQVTPRGGGGGGVQARTINLHFNLSGGSPADVEEGVMGAFRSLTGRRLAARRI